MLAGRLEHLRSISSVRTITALTWALEVGDTFASVHQAGGHFRDSSSGLRMNRIRAKPEKTTQRADEQDRDSPTMSLCDGGRPIAGTHRDHLHTGTEDPYRKV